MDAMTKEGTKNWVLSRWSDAAVDQFPFRHWLLNRALPPDIARDLAQLPVIPPEIKDTVGRRETHNESRWFLTPDRQRNHPSCRALCDAFQSPRVSRMLRWLTGVRLANTFLRIEFCQDRGDFWLEPHTDIGAKKFTALIYLTDSAESDALGTDIYDLDRQYVSSAPGGFNKGLIFVPGAETWHGFRRRNFEGVRTSIIINYVGPEWRSRHELSFPDQQIS